VIAGIGDEGLVAAAQRQHAGEEIEAVIDVVVHVERSGSSRWEMVLDDDRKRPLRGTENGAVAVEPVGGAFPGGSLHRSTGCGTRGLSGCRLQVGHEGSPMHCRDQISLGDAVAWSETASMSAWRLRCRSEEHVRRF